MEMERTNPYSLYNYSRQMGMRALVAGNNQNPIKKVIKAEVDESKAVKQG